MRSFEECRFTVLMMAHFAATALLLVFAMAIGFSWAHLPAIEGYAFPVVIGSLSAEPKPTRTHERACFSLAMKKVRPGDAIVYQFFAEGRQNEHWLAPFLLAAHIANNDDTLGDDDYAPYQVGDAWTRRWCASLPSALTDTQPIRITGYVVHRAHPLWQTETPLPSVEIGKAR